MELLLRKRTPGGFAAVMGVAAALVMAACGTDSSAPAVAEPAVTEAAPGEGVPAAWSGVTDPAAIPLGDGKVSDQPTVGYLDSCKTTFGGRGAPHGGPWIDEANGTWDSTTKASVSGSITWPQATYAENVEGDARTITSRDLPTEQVTGSFPIARSDDAYQYDRNPNAIAEKVVDLSLPSEPVEAATPSCVPMGAIGILKNGVYVFNALDAAGADAAAHETQDVCDGHPDGAEFYHYHDIPSCLLDAAGTNEDGTTKMQSATLVGYALDGFGIYVERDAQGNLPTNADLDECHGRTSLVTFNGEEQAIYHYSATIEYPYTVGCFRGTPVQPPDHSR